MPAERVDICLVSTRRPDLLRPTLESFQQRLFKNFAIGKFYANVDPVFGDSEDHRIVLELIRQYFPDANIHEPETPGFCEAVRRNWAATSADYVLHLEDDWRLNIDIDRDALADFADARVMQVAFHSKEKNWDTKRRGKIHYRRKYLKVLGFRMPVKYKVPGFTTSPSLLRGDFARHTAGLLDTRLDPEKQFYNGLNQKLEAYVAPFLSTLLSDDSQFVVTDLGRDWRDRRGIQKSIENGASVWTS
ncbi:MAG TPA: hypothetical protein VL202_25065 [Pararhizobium sp.]|uniref:glycosyltransferase family 2 protein n=1 Tax=Pararhizobium sp. TaxID=1977563 RepID=UPI002C4BC2C4|nr:hypothetical protein [Pararhizobium sp.]HTO34414.1 hypothetical protein [Pararhizobium sp.]